MRLAAIHKDGGGELPEICAVKGDMSHGQLYRRTVEHLHKTTPATHRRLPAHLLMSRTTLESPSATYTIPQPS